MSTSSPQNLTNASANSTPASMTLDISSFKRRQKYVLFIPRLLQIVYAVMIVFASVAFGRMFLMTLANAAFGAEPLPIAGLLGIGLFSSRLLTATARLGPCRIQTRA
jgi:hypothetical protein